MRTKHILALFLCWSIASLSHAQTENKQRKNITIHAGYVAGELLSSTAAGFHLSLNPQVRFTPFFSLEGQLGYTQFQSDGLFGSSSSRNSRINAWVGPRLYFNDESRNTRPYFNLLLGGGIENHRNNRSETERIRQTAANFGLQSGFHLEFRRKYNAGLSLGYSAAGDIGPTLILMLKAGYTFPVGN